MIPERHYNVLGLQDIAFIKHERVNSVQSGVVINTTLLLTQLVNAPGFSGTAQHMCVTCVNFNMSLQKYYNLFIKLHIFENKL